MTLTWRDRLIFLSPVAIVGALTLTPAMEGGPTVCPFALCTGVACPGCGMTRAAARLLRGDLSSAVRLHPLVPWIAFLAVAGWIWFMLNKAGSVGAPSKRVVNGTLILTLIALVAVWLARLVSGSLPPV